MMNAVKRRRSSISVIRLYCRCSGYCFNLSGFFLVIFWLGISCKSVSAVVECNSTNYCQDLLHPASECIDGLCVNPFYKGGCLHHFKPGWKKVRVCNSDDPPEALKQGYCRQPEQRYTEIRIASQNWESVFFSAWALQILLSEILDIPTTIESGLPDARVSLYDPTLRMDYGTSNEWDQLKLASKIGDCRKASRSVDNYEPCAHVVPEVWNPRLRDIAELAAEGYTEPAHPLGALGQQSWLVPQFTGKHDPSLLTHLGLSGQENRQKLADTFLWPTTWAEYCDEVSLNNCRIADNTTSRPPNDETEGGKFYVEGLYGGYFRKTDAGNCTLNPSTCRGHLADYPCGWASFANAQAYHLDIALEAIPYSYNSLIEIWWAANHTKSHVVGHWWSPEILFQQFLGSDSELIRISLPSPTQECVNNRVPPDDRCSPDFETSVGDPLGACDEPPHPLQKVIASSLYDISNDPDVPSAVQSPAYDAVRSYRMTDLQIGEIFDFWFAIGKDWEYDPREAVCKWVVQYYEEFQSFVPRTHPRIFRAANEEKWDNLQIATLSLSLVATVFVLVAIVGTYLKRHLRALGRAQLEFVALLLVGLFFVTCASLLLAVAPSNFTCIAGVWFLNVGYTLELAPLVVKMAAINRLMIAARQMRRVVLRRRNLFGIVFALTGVVVVYMIIWTVYDPFIRSVEYILTDEITPEGETVVIMSPYCESKYDNWTMISLGWQILLLLCATVLAFQTRDLRCDMNETNTLAILIYSHFFFVALRVATFFLESSVRRSTARFVSSMFLSVDLIATVCIYFLPKLLDISIGPRGFTSNFDDGLTRGRSRTSGRRSSFTADNDDTKAHDSHRNDNMNNNSYFNNNGNPTNNNSFYSDNESRHRPSDRDLSRSRQDCASERSAASVDNTGSIRQISHNSINDIPPEDLAIITIKTEDPEKQQQEQQPEDNVDTSQSSSVCGDDQKENMTES